MPSISKVVESTLQFVRIEAQLESRHQVRSWSKGANNVSDINLTNAFHLDLRSATEIGPWFLQA